MAEPYEVRIPALELGQRQKLTFRLLRDEVAVVVVVSLSYLDIVGETRSIILKKGGQLGVSMINSAQFSQEADLNSRARFDLAIERLAEEERSYHLAAANLPEEIDASFLDRETGGERPQVKLAGETTRREVDLELRIPTKLDSQFVGAPLVFYALVTDQEGIARLEHEDEHGAGAIPVARMV